MISVIIPTFAHAASVKAAVASAASQQGVDVEIVVVNDGSPDDTAERLRPLVDAGTIRYVEQTNAGQAAARNRGLAEARGEYIAFLDDDDEWPAGKLQRQVGLLQAHPQAVMVYGMCLRSDGVSLPADDRHLSGDLRSAIRQHCHIVSPGQTLIRAEVLRQIGGLDPDLPGTDDWDLYIRLADHGYILFDPHVALHYRLHPTNASKNLVRMHASALRLREKHFGRRPSPQQKEDYDGCSQFIRDFVLFGYRERIVRAYYAGHYRAALAELTRASAAFPDYPFRRSEWRALRRAIDAASPKQGAKPAVA